MSITVNNQLVLLMSVYFPHSGYADLHVKKAYKANEKHMKVKKTIQIVGGDFNAELGPGIGVERISVGQHTLNEGNKRGDWMKLDDATEALRGQHNVQKKRLRN